MTSNQSAAAKPPDGSSDVDPLTPSSIDAPVLDPVPPPAPPSLLAEPAESVAAVAASSSTRSLRPSGLGRSLRPGGAALRPGGAGRGYKGGAGSNTDYSAGAAGSAARATIAARSMPASSPLDSPLDAALDSPLIEPSLPPHIPCRGGGGKSALASRTRGGGPTVLTQSIERPVLPTRMRRQRRGRHKFSM